MHLFRQVKTMRNSVATVVSPRESGVTTYYN